MSLPRKAGSTCELLDALGWEADVSIHSCRLQGPHGYLLQTPATCCSLSCVEDSDVVHRKFCTGAFICQVAAG